jgi:hypothetical protein
LTFPPLKSLLSDEKVKAPETPATTYPVLEEFAVPESMPDLPTSEDDIFPKDGVYIAAYVFAFFAGMMCLQLVWSR